MDRPIQSVTVGIPVPDLSEATEWYRDLLGDRKEISPVPGVREFEVFSGCWLQLFESERPEHSEGIFRIGVSDIERRHKQVVDLEAELSPIETVPGAVRYFNFRDPYGNRLGFYQVL